jgi:CheY-like chemotaxis protein
LLRCATRPAAALTAYARTVDRTRSLKAGFQMHLSKPVQPTELAAAVLVLAGSAGTTPQA